MLDRDGATFFAVFILACSARLAGETESKDAEAAALDAPSMPIEGGARGRPCISSDERQPFFSGYEVTEVSLEPPSDGCLGDICLVNHFQGRVTCPYGQSDVEAKGNGTRPESELCHIGPGSGPGSRVAVAVNAQLERRRPVDAVYCTCRCAGPDPSAKYCECPAGFECIEVVPPPLLGASEYEGSYCLKSGTAYQPGSDYGLACKPGSTGELPCGSHDGW
jgi:hypothetical protein